MANIEIEKEVDRRLLKSNNDVKGRIQIRKLIPIENVEPISVGSVPAVRNENP